MGIPAIGVGDLNQMRHEMQVKSLADGKGVDVKALDVKAGDIVSAQVVGRSQQGVQVSINGQTLKLPGDALPGVQVGQNIKLEVIQAQEQQLTLRVVSEGDVQKPVQGSVAQGVPAQGSQVTLKPFDGILQTQLKEMGLQATEQNMTILKAQREFGLPITREVFQTLKNAMYFLTEGATMLGTITSDGLQEGQPSQGGAQGSAQAGTQASAPLGNQGGANLGTQVDWRQDPKGFFESLSQLTTRSTARGGSGQGTVPQGLLTEGTTPQAPLPTTLGEVPVASGQVPGVLDGPDQTLQQPLTKAQQIQNALQQIAQANQGASSAAPVTTENLLTPEETLKPLGAQSQITSKTFFEGLTQALSEMVSQKEAMVGTLAFMTEQKMPLQTLDILITHQFLKGAMGLSEGIFQLFEGNGLDNPTLQGLEKQVADLKQHMLQWDQLHLGLDGDALKAQTEAIEALSKSLQNLMITSETGEKAAQFEATQRTTQVLQDSQNWSMVFLPMGLKERVQDIEIYVKHQGHKKEALDPDNSMIYIALKTNHLDQIRVKITAKKETLSIVVMTENEKIEKYLESAATELLESVKPLVSKEIQLSFKSDEETPNLAAMSRLDVKLTQLFDTFV